jgi:hypothetical protein
MTKAVDIPAVPSCSSASTGTNPAAANLADGAMADPAAADSAMANPAAKVPDGQNGVAGPAAAGDVAGPTAEDKEEPPVR